MPNIIGICGFFAGIIEKGMFNMVEIKYENGVLTALLKGEIDHHSAADMRITIDGETEKLRPRTLILDFSGIGFMDSSGVGLVLGRYKNMSLLGGRLKVVSRPPRLQKVFALSGLAALGILN